MSIIIDESTKVVIQGTGSQGTAHGKRNQKPRRFARTPSIASTSTLQIVRPVSTPPSRTAPESGKKKL